MLEVLYPGPKRAVKGVADLQSVIAGLKDGDYISLLVMVGDARGKTTNVVNIKVGN